MIRFTKEELAKYDGKNGAPAYVAYNHLVYDITNSFLWQKGRHQAMHQAGLDYTEGLKGAPHGHELLEKFPVVGFLEMGLPAE